MQNSNIFDVVQLQKITRLKNKIESTPRQKSIRALEIFRVQKLILNATS